MGKAVLRSGSRIALNVFSFTLVFSLLFLQSQLGWAKQFEGIAESSIREIIVTTEDGVAEKIIHLQNPGKPIVLLEPGFGAQGLSLELPAAAIYNSKHYDVFIGNWRGSAKLPEGLTALGKSNGLTAVARKDFPAHVRYILNEYATPMQKAYGISCIGHSMGGMMIMGGLSDPKLFAEFQPYIRGIVLLQSPHHLRYLSRTLKAFAYVGIPTINALKNGGVKAIDMHSRLLAQTKELKSAGGITGRIMIPAVENFAIALTRMALSPGPTGRATFRRAFFKMSAHSIPLDLIEEFAQAMVNGGEFLDSDRRPLIIPENIVGIPVQVLRTELDNLAPWKQQEEYYNRIGSDEKQLVDIFEFNHLSSMLVQQNEAEAKYFSFILNFLDDPHASIKNGNKLSFHPNCESLLTKFFKKFRK
jgi:alpha-beta hydrolase superfamily lysophospholipase